ncbi:MAG TPA: hypothetical protein VFV53_06685, partial [Candidatus Limnocylindrales bacterium]|nr:hypothetical protein [Candidatus Limnocylindrales bacterium]
MNALPSSLHRGLILLATLALVAACSPGTGDLGSVATPPPTTSPSIDAPSPEPTAGESPAGESPNPTPDGSPGETTTIRVYFFLESFSHQPGLAPILYEIPRTQAVATAAMGFLLDGPSDMEDPSQPALFTTIPDGT